MANERISNGQRIKFYKQNNMLTSIKIYSDGNKMVRILLDLDKMEYKLVDPVTGFIHDSGGNVTNYEVLLRKAKRALVRLLDIYFTKESRNVRNSY